MVSDLDKTTDFVTGRLQSLLDEAASGTLPWPDRATWLRRYPAHADAIGRLFDAAARLRAGDANSARPPQNPRPGSPSSCTLGPVAGSELDATAPDAGGIPPSRSASGFSSVPPGPSAQAVQRGPRPDEATTPTVPSNAPTRRPCAGEEPARSEPLVPSSRTTVLREDSHGRLLRLPDRRRAYLLPAERLQGRSPASLYLARAERIATAAVPETEAPEIERRSDGAVLLSWRPWRGRALRIPVARHGAEVPRFVLRVLRAVEILGRLHARGAAHGRLGLDHFRIHARSGRLRIAMALEVGPGQDGDDLAAQQAADIRVVGALLYAAFAGQGGTEGIREILDRAATGELPLLAARRPDLIPGLAVAVDRALRAEPRSLPSLGEFRAFLRRLVEFRAGPAPSGPSVRRLYRGWVGSAAVVLVIAAIAFGQHLIGASHDAGDARLDTGDRITTRLQHIRGLVRAGRIDDASAAYQDLAIELGLPPGTAPVPVTGTAPATSPDGALDDRDRR